MAKKSATPRGVLEGGETLPSTVQPMFCAGCGTETEQRALCATCEEKLARSKLGRPTLYDPESHPQRAFELCLLGATDVQMASIFNISEATLNTWKNLHDNFLESIKRGKNAADAKVAASLFERALGYEHPDVDIRVVDKEIVETPIMKKYPPDTVAAIFWLKNRQNMNWRDRSITEVVGKDDGPVQTEVGTATDYAALREKIKAKKAEAK